MRSSSSRTETSSTIPILWRQKGCMGCTLHTKIPSKLLIVVDLTRILGGRQAPNARYERGVPSPAYFWGSVVSSSSGVRGSAPTGNAFWRIFKTTGRFFLYLYHADALSNLVLEILKHDKIWGTQFALASLTPNSGGGICSRLSS